MTRQEGCADPDDAFDAAEARGDAAPALERAGLGAAVIDVQNLGKRFGDQVVLDGVSFTVRAGETLAVLGRSGTGKSVLLKTIIALMDPDAGSVRVAGRDLHALTEADRLRARRSLGYVFQGAALFDSLTVAENVGFPLAQERRPQAEIDAAVRDRLATVGLAHAAAKYPSELSGGMQKRVGLARAIIHRPAIVLYDEPTTGLDPLTTDVINRIILDLRQRERVTAIVVTHDLGSAFTIADRILMLEEGRVVADGTPAEIHASANPWVQRFLGQRSSDAPGPATGTKRRIVMRPGAG